MTMTRNVGTAKLPDGRPLRVNDEVLVEPPGLEGRLVFWLPGQRGNGFRDWDRVGSVVHASVATDQGICTTAATAVRARQLLGGALGKLVQRLRRSRAIRTWTLPDGASVEQSGERRTDLILAWAEDESAPLDEAKIRARWPESRGVWPVGRNLYLVSVDAPKGPAPPSEQAPEPIPKHTPRQNAERALAEARAAGDPSRVVLALTDLGHVLVKERDALHATVILEEALAEVRQIGDRHQEVDVMSALGLALLHSGQSRRALDVIQPALAHAREAGDRHAEKIALDIMGLARGDLRDHAGALACTEQGLALASVLGDRHHQANLLWFAALQHAELNRRDQAIASAQAAVDLLSRLGKPQAPWYAHHLAQYRSGDVGAPLRSPGGGDFLTTSSFVTATDTTALVSQATPPASTVNGPGLLRMALTATEAMMKFLGTGLKTVPPDTYRRRLEVCSTCEHHTGLRCRICGCFTDAKARLPYEDCPAGRWPK